MGVIKQQVQVEVERQLRRAGSAVFSSEEAGAPSDVAFLTVFVTIRRHTGSLYAYTVDLVIYQTVALLRDPMPRSFATWMRRSIGLVEPTNWRAISTSMSRQIKQFIHAYWAMNSGASPGGRRHAAARACLRQAQERLQTAGFSPGPLDGWLGPHTRMVLRRYQQRKGLRVTGTLDAQTLKALAPGNGVPWSVDGIPVVFQVDPHRARYASIRPARARTQSGRGHAIVQAALAGQVQITVRGGPSRNERRSQSSCPSPREMGMQMRAAHDREQLMCSWT